MILSKQFLNEQVQKRNLQENFRYDTNNPEIEHKIVEPHAIDSSVIVFKNLQRLESVGLVYPVGEEHMYFAAMNSKSCKLTPLGQHYWNCVKSGKI